jgi:hypothetical protein
MARILPHPLRAYRTAVDGLSPQHNGNGSGSGAGKIN